MGRREGMGRGGRNEGDGERGQERWKEIVGR